MVATPGASGGYPNNASVTATTADLNLGNNSASGVAFSQANTCTTPTNTAGTPAGVVNTYFSGAASVAATATSVTVGPAPGGLQEQLQAALQQLKEVEATLSEDVLMLYQRQVEGRGEDALSSVQDRNCPACYTAITAQSYNDLLAGRLVTCRCAGVFSICRSEHRTNREAATR